MDDFTDDGGRVLLVAEPTRQEVGLVGGQFTSRSRTSALASRLGVGFGTDYLYDQSANDGNYRHVFATPATGGDDPLVRDVERTTAYTATTVHVADGRAVLTTVETTRRSGSGRPGEYAVVATTDGGETIAVGDLSFMRTGRHGVADNEVFIARLVEHLAGGNDD